MWTSPETSETPSIPSEFQQLLTLFSRPTTRWIPEAEKARARQFIRQSTAGGQLQIPGKGIKADVEEALQILNNKGYMTRASRSLVISALLYSNSLADLVLSDTS